MQKRKLVGLALGGGVARGMAHVGVLSVLEKEGIPIDFVAGTSAGSLIGAAYCSGMCVEAIRDIGLRLRWWHLARLTWPVRGFVTFEPMARWLVREFGDLDFSELRIPYAAIATDMETGQPVTLSRGKLAPAVQASCSVPGIVTPVELDGRLLADGSLANTVPVTALRVMGADIVIGVDIFASSIRRRLGPFGLGVAALEILIRRAGGGIDDADCLISPDLAGKSYIRFSKRAEYFALGEEAALARIPCIRSLLFD